jgi:hypothetical protein
MTARPRFHRLRRLRLVFVLLAGLIALTVTAPTVFIAVTCYRPFVQHAGLRGETLRATAGVPHYERAGSATFLTLPEWYIVYSTEEYAAFVATRPPSHFPWFRSIAQFWRTYTAACRATRRVYAFEPGVHVMLGVTGVSFSAEQAVKGAYETTLGRVAEWLGGHDTEEDAVARRTLQEYGRFMHTAPWYEFPFATRLRALWRETPLRGAHLVRKWERRGFLSAEYGTKAVYGRVIRSATGTVRAPEDLRLYAWAEDVPDAVFAEGRVKKVRTLGPRSFIVALPRYEQFTGVALDLVHRGARFRDIAANDVIVLSLLAPPDAGRGLPPQAAVVFEEPVLTSPRVRRLAVRAPVGALRETVAALEARGATIERLYDY